MHNHLLLLGSTGDEDQLLRARVALQDSGILLASSAIMHAPSVVPGDVHHYVNQSLLLQTPLARAEIASVLKSIERKLGRNDGSPGCLIDIDLVAECGPARALLWSNPAKLEHPLFRSLAAELCPELR